MSQELMAGGLDPTLLQNMVNAAAASAAANATSAATTAATAAAIAAAIAAIPALPASAQLVPLVIPLTNLSLVSNLAQIIFPYAGTITAASISSRVLVSGNFTGNVKNAAGTTLLSWTVTGAGKTACTISNSAIIANDTLSINIGGLAVGLADVYLTLWISLT